MPKGITTAATRWARLLSVALALISTGVGSAVPGRAEIVKIDYESYLSDELPTLSEAEQETIDTCRVCGSR